MDTSGYAIGEIFNQLTLNQYFSNINFSKSDIGQWHLEVFFSSKKIPVEIRYKTHN